MEKEPEANVTTSEATVQSVPRVVRRSKRASLVTERDRHLMALLATARYLTGEQLARCIFMGREESTRKRLLVLSASTALSESPAYLRRIFFRTFEGQRVAVWALADAGYSIAERMLEQVKRPQGDVGIGFLEHTIVLNELLVKLVTGQLPPPQRGRKIGTKHSNRAKQLEFARIGAQPFRWVASDSAKLPWTEYEPVAQEVRQRVIQPDAVLELPRLRRRVFIECEMGTHSVVAESAEKNGATLSKVDRYEKFLTGLADVSSKTTFYAQAYPDGFTPEVLFLVRTDSRANTIAAAVSNWRKAGPGRRTAIFAQTVESASAQLLQGLGISSPARAVHNEIRPANVGSAPTVLSADEVEALRRFYVATHARFKSMRDEARAQRGPIPEYPSSIGEVGQVLTRLGALKPRAV